MIAKEQTLILLEDELPGARGWARRHDVPLEWNDESLELRVTLTQAETKELFYLRGRFDDYREIAPEWVFTDAAWTAAPTQRLFPAPATPPTGRGASMFHTQPVICAPFNRLAYKERSGPHQDWGGPANWLQAGNPGDVKARHVGDMLSVIEQHFSVTRGRMG